MSTKIPVHSITLSEISQAANTLFNAFKNDPLMLWVYGDEHSYQAKALPVFQTWVKYAVLYGVALRTPHFESVALRKKPGDHKFSFWRMLRAGLLSNPAMMGKEAFRRLMIFDKLTTEVRKKHMGKQAYWYCWLIGTQPDYQYQGFGSALMDATFKLANESHLPCYLETANNTSKQVHLNKHYKIIAELILPNSQNKITAMVKKLG